MAEKKKRKERENRRLVHARKVVSLVLSERPIFSKNSVILECLVNIYVLTNNTRNTVKLKFLN